MSTITENKNYSTTVIEACSRHDLAVSSPTRRLALKSLSDLGLPGPKAEEYRFTPLVRTLEKIFPEWPAEATSKSDLKDVKPFLIEGLDAHVVVLVNGAYSDGLSHPAQEGFKIGPLTESAGNEVLFNLADFTKDAFVALNTAMWTGGVAIEVPDNQKVSKPLLLLNVVDSSTASVVSHTRVALSVGTNSSVTLISRNVIVGSGQASFSTLVEEILVSEKGSFDYCRIQDNNTEVSFTQTSIKQLDESRVNTFTLTLDGKLIRNNLHISIEGERSESHFHGLYLLDGETIADNHTVVDHRKPNAVSNELYKGVMDGKSRGVFNGKIFVRPDAQKTNAFQSNRNILLSEQASINTKPQLEIWADDVKCSHGCTTGQLDEEAMFYIRSRGIPAAQARAMLLYAFAAETFSFIQDSSLHAYINALVTKRLNMGS